MTKDILDQYGENPQAQFLSTSSINNISKTQEDVNNLRSSLLNLNEQTNVRDLGKINATDPDIGSIRIETEGRNEYQQSFIDDFNRRHVTPAEPANTTSYTTNKLPPEINIALRDNKRIEREYNNFKEKTKLTTEERESLEALYKGGFSLDEAIQVTRNKFSGINVKEAIAHKKNLRFLGGQKSLYVPLKGTTNTFYHLQYYNTSTTGLFHHKSITNFSNVNEKRVKRRHFGRL